MSRNGGTGANTSISDFDVIVIGTGMGGSAAGAISALNGMRTLILEKNPRPGGACSYYEKEGFKIDTGTHLFIRRNGGPFGTCTRRLGMGNAIDFRSTKYTSHVKGLGLDFIMPRNLLRAAWELVPLKLFWQARHILTRITPLQYFGIANFMLDVMFMSEQRMEKFNDMSIQDFVNQYTHDPNISVLLSAAVGLYYIMPPWESSAGETISDMQKMAWLMLTSPVGYPKGGCVTIPQTFLDGAGKHGATLRLNTGVKKINISGNKVTGVTLDDGTVINSRAVISTSNVSDTVMKFTGPEFYPAEYVERVKQIKPSWTAVQAKIGVKKKLVKAGSLVGGVPVDMEFKLKEADSNIRNFISQINSGTLPDMLPIYCPVPSNYDPALAPEGCQLLTAVTCAPTLDVELKQDPQVWIDGMMKALFDMVPELEENIIFCDTWSVQTLANWIGKSNGSAITTAQTMDQVGFRRPSHETPVKGLYLAGDCAGPARGVGTELACQSGMDCADLVASHVYNCIV